MLRGTPGRDVQARPGLLNLLLIQPLFSKPHPKDFCSLNLPEPCVFVWATERIGPILPPWFGAQGKGMAPIAIQLVLDSWLLLVLSVLYRCTNLSLRL
jgi:hypothetical protein